MKKFAFTLLYTTAVLSIIGVAAPAMALQACELNPHMWQTLNICAKPVTATGAGFTLAGAQFACLDALSNAIDSSSLGPMWRKECSDSCGIVSFLNVSYTSPTRNNATGGSGSIAVTCTGMPQCVAPYGPI